MSSEKWRKVTHLFQEALKRPEAERAAFLDAACEDDPKLLQAVISLLSADEEAGSFLEEPVTRDS